jgi:phosphatidylinositol-3-phosphatase
VRMRVVSLAVAMLVAVLAPLSGQAGASSVAPTASGPCGTKSVAPTYQHVIWVWMENHSYPSIIGSSQAPYENKLANACGLATNYHNISHPSLPNYVGATSGLSVAAVQKFASDCSPTAACSTSAASIFAQAPSWRAYEESMPSNCLKTDSGEYAVRHNPPPYFTTLTGCSTSDVPYTQLATDLTNNTLPAFAFVTPNLIDDTHDAGVRTGDTWLAKNLPVIFNSAPYQAGTVVLFLAWDEGEGGSSNNCPKNTTDIGCHVVDIVVSPSTVPGTKSSVLFNHYSMLRTTEELLNLPFLGQAARAKSMKTAFKL